MKIKNYLITLSMVIICMGCLKETDGNNEVEKAMSDDSLATAKANKYKEEATRIMDFYGADIGWKSKGKTTLDFTDLISEKTISFKGSVKDLYYENGEPYAVIYDMGTSTNSFICYAQLHHDQLDILKRNPSARGYFAVKIRGVLAGRPEFSTEDDCSLSKLIIKSNGDMVGFFLRED